MFRVVFAGRIGARSSSLVDQTLNVGSLLEALEWAASALRATKDQSLLDQIETLRVIDLSKKSSLVPTL